MKKCQSAIPSCQAIRSNSSSTIAASVGSQNSTTISASICSVLANTQAFGFSSERSSKSARNSTGICWRYWPRCRNNTACIVPDWAPMFGSAVSRMTREQRFDLGDAALEHQRRRTVERDLSAQVAVVGGMRLGVGEARVGLGELADSREAAGHDDRRLGAEARRMPRRQRGGQRQACRRIAEGREARLQQQGVVAQAVAADRGEDLFGIADAALVPKVERAPRLC